jgi:hypothetical protein
LVNLRPAQIKFLDGIHDDVRQMIFRQPVAQTRR